MYVQFTSSVQGEDVHDAILLFDIQNIFDVQSRLFV